MIRTIMHIDMNAFFASVEQQCNPFLRNKPIAVIGTNRRTVVTTASYEARSFGVKTGMNVWEAKRCCPRLILVPGDNAKYTATCVKLIAIFKRYTPLVELFSIDEAFLDITGSFTLFHTAAHIATSIKKRIKDTLGLRCSIGIAPNKLLAKLASGLRKPDGLVTIKHDEVASLLEDLPVDKLCGIGPSLDRSLAEQGIRTCGQLGRACTDALEKQLGSLGKQLHAVDPGHPDVAEDDLEGRALHGPQGLLGTGRAHHLVALGAQHQLKALPEGVVVVNDEDPIRHVRRATSDVWSIGVRGFGRAGFRRSFR